MSAKILIKRVVPEDKAEELKVLLREMRTRTTNRKGYISGETLKRFDKPDEFLVISTWQSVDEWRDWVLSDERNEIQDRINALLGSETEYEIYTYG